MNSIDLRSDQIPGSGNTSSPIMIVNSYATAVDHNTGEARASGHLKEYLEQIGLTEDDYYYTNAIKVFHEKGYKYKVSDITPDKPALKAEIEAMRPQYVLLVGAQALKATIGGNITSTAGTIIEVDGVKYVPTYSPGVIFHDPSKTKLVDEAFNTFEDLINGIEKKLPKLNVKLVDNLLMLHESLEYIKEKPVAYDIETTGLDQYHNDITLLGYGDDKVQYIIPLEVKFSPLKGKHKLQTYYMIQAIKGLSHASERIAGNGKFDNLFLREKVGMSPQLTFDDVLASHILDENTPNGVKENAILECGALDWDVNLNLKTGHAETEEDWQDFLTYLGYDIYYEYKLWEVFAPRIADDPALEKLFYHFYMPVIRAYEDIEEYGVRVNVEQFDKVDHHLTERIQDVENRLSVYGENVNWGSPQQIQRVLYEELELPILDRTPSGSPATNEATLKQLQEYHELPQLILEYRGYKTQYTHFIQGWKDRMHKGRLHPRYLMLTKTGRTSCKDPNLQQVPRDPTIRSLIGAPKGWSFIEVDFSQAELRIAAILSGDKSMTEIYTEGGDIHTHTYEMISGEKVSSDPHEKKEQRKMAKAVNFGFVYGMGANKFQQYARDSYGVTLTLEEATLFRKNFFDEYASLQKWHSKQRKLVRSQGEVRSPIGRKRRLPDIYSSNKSKQAEAERQSINSPVQGFGSDITLMGMAEVTGHSLSKEEAYQLDHDYFHCVGTVHDAVLFEVKNEYLITFAKKVKLIMDRPKALNSVFNFTSPIPIVVDMSIGKNWGNPDMEVEFDGDWRKQIRDYQKKLQSLE